MQYVGLNTQIHRNNRLSVMLLFAFPLLILGLVYAFFLIVSGLQEEGISFDWVNENFLMSAPMVVIAVGLWFVIAFFAHSSIINSATGARTLERRDNKRIYNLVENLCISRGMKMPKVNIIHDPALNAFASGINDRTYTVTLTTGLIEALDDAELEGVIAHELMHIRNRDVRLMIVAIVFVGILAFLSEILFRSLIYGRPRSSGGKKNDGQILVIIALVLAVIGYISSVLFRFALSRKREYMADAGAAEMTKNPRALASALRKVSKNYKVSSVKSEEVAELFIENRPEKAKGSDVKAMFHNMFATHPPIEKRIAFLEQI
jgi:heat shock protein HtpX